MSGRADYFTQRYMLAVSLDLAFYTDWGFILKSVKVRFGKSGYINKLGGGGNVFTFILSCLLGIQSSFISAVY